MNSICFSADASRTPACFSAPQNPCAAEKSFPPAAERLGQPPALEEEKVTVQSGNVRLGPSPDGSGGAANQQQPPRADSAPAGHDGEQPAGGGAPLFPGSNVTPEDEKKTLPAAGNVPPKNVPPVKYRPQDAVLALLCYGAGYLFLRMVRIFDLGLGVLLFTGCFCGLALAWKARSGGNIPRKSWPWLGVTLAAALPFGILTNHPALSLFNLLFLMLCVVYWTSVLFESRLEERLGRFLVTDLWNHFIILPFGNLGLGFGAVNQGIRRGKNVRAFLPVAVTALLCLPVLFYAALQLTAADETFARMVEDLFRGVDLDLGTLAARMILAVPVGCWFFGLFFGAAERRGGNCFHADEAARRADRRRRLPVSVPVTALSLFCLLYLVFFAAQISTLLGVLAGEAPESMSYSQYARDGFFELCRVAVVNLLLLGAGRLYTRFPEKKPSRALTVLDLLLCAQTLLLIVTALSKMGLYIRFYGLTLLRVYTSWFMVLLFAVFTILILSRIRPICTPRWLAITFCALFLALCWCDVGGIIARHNIGRYRAGLDEQLDTVALRSVAVAAAPYARDLYDSGDPRVKAQAEELLAWAWMDSTPDGAVFYSDGFWLGGSLQKLRAREAARVENSLLRTEMENGREVRRWKWQ